MIAATTTTAAMTMAVAPAAAAPKGTVSRTGAGARVATFSAWFNELVKHERIPLDIANAASGMVRALPEPYFPRDRQRRAAVACLRIALKWVFDGYRAKDGCAGLDLYLEPSEASWLKHELDILVDLGWEVGRFFPQPKTLSTVAVVRRPSAIVVAPIPTLAHDRRTRPTMPSQAITHAPVRRSTAPRSLAVYPPATATAAAAAAAAIPRSPPAREPKGPITGDHAAVSLIPDRRVTIRRPAPARHARPGVVADNDDDGGDDNDNDDDDDNRDPTWEPPARRRAASIRGERSRRSRCTNRTPPPIRSMAPESDFRMSTSRGSASRDVVHPSRFHVGM